MATVSPTHGDGEIPPSETVAQLKIRTCSHCHNGLMLRDSYDSDCNTCTCCGRNDFQPSIEVLTEEPQPSGPVDPIRHHVHAPRSRVVRPPAIPEGRLIISQ